MKFRRAKLRSGVMSLTVDAQTGEEGLDGGVKEPEEQGGANVGERADDEKWAAQRRYVVDVLENVLHDYEVAVAVESYASKFGDENEDRCHETGFLEFVCVLHVDQETVPSGFAETLAVDGEV